MTDSEPPKPQYADVWRAIAAILGCSRAGVVDADPGRQPGSHTGGRDI